MVFNWNDEKNRKLKATPGKGFEDIVVAVENGDVLEVLENPSSKYKKQIIMIIKFRDYAYAVPTLVSKDEFFFKTIFPSRKYTSIYLTENKNE